MLKSFLLTPKAKATKKSKQGRLHQTTRLLHSKGNQWNEKATYGVGENKRISHLCCKGLISKTYNEFIQLNRKDMQNNQELQANMFKIGQKIQINFSPKKTAHVYMNRCPTSLVTREMQTKTTVTCNLTPVRTAIIKKTINSKCWCKCGKKGTFVHHP